MPQMSPLSWLLLPLLIMMMVFITNTMNLYHMNSLSKHNTTTIHMLHHHWMW